MRRRRRLGAICSPRARRSEEFPRRSLNDAWRSLVVGNYLMAVGDRMHYSAGNAYDHLYEGECGDTTRSLLLFGHHDDARKMVGPLLDFDRKATRFHVAGHKLQLLTHYYWVTRDKEYLREKEKIWRGVDRASSPKAARAEGQRPSASRQLRRGHRAAGIRAQLQRELLARPARPGRRRRRSGRQGHRRGDFRGSGRLPQSDPRRGGRERTARHEAAAFIPQRHSSSCREGVCEDLTDTRLGSYYDLMAPYIIGSGVFGPGDRRETWMIDYLREHGGLAMGMIRCNPHQGEFDGEPGVNVLYGLRLVLAQLRRDDVGNAQVAFYGRFAHGMAARNVHRRMKARASFTATRTAGRSICRPTAPVMRCS